MDWVSVIKELSGELGALPAVIIAALAFAYWQKSKEVSSLYEQRLQDMRDNISDIGRREAETITTLNSISATLNTVSALIQNGGSSR